VVDKATKLETNYNRIHEVRTRFEVLLRDARIAWFEGVINGEDRTQLDAAYKRREAQLHDDFAFVAECNQGGEFMAPERIERLRAIAAPEVERFLDVHAHALSQRSAVSARTLVSVALHASDRAALAQGLLSLAERSTAADLRGYGGRVLLVTSPFNDEPWALANFLEQPQVTQIPEAGHWLMLDAPSAVNEALDALLAKVAP